MNFEQAYRKTLIKWQRLAAGEASDPSEDCGICDWARAHQRIHRRLCKSCPAYLHYRRGCVHATHVTDAIDAYEENNWTALQRLAQLVVEELLSIKVSLFVEARHLDKT